MELTKEMKILLLKILKSDILTLYDAEQIAKLFPLVLTDEQFKKALEMIKPKNIQ